MKRKFQNKKLSWTCRKIFFNVLLEFFRQFQTQLKKADVLAKVQSAFSLR